MKIQFLAGLALGAVVGMLVVDNCPKAQKVIDEGKRDARFAIKEMKHCVKKLGKKLRF